MLPWIRGVYISYRNSETLFSHLLPMRPLMPPPRPRPRPLPIPGPPIAEFAADLGVFCYFYHS